MPNDPTSVAGLRARWKASTISSPPADGAALQTWTDTSVNVYNATQASVGLRPVYRTSGAFLPSSQPCVEFTSASSQELSSSCPSNTAFTRFSVVRFKSLPAGAAWEPFTGAAAGYTQLIVSTGKFGLGVAGVTWVLDPASTPGTVAIDTWYVLTSSGNASNSGWNYINGSLDASTTSTSHTPTATTLNLGSRASGGEFLNGYLAEVLDYSAVLSANDLSTVHSYIQETYGVTVSDYTSGAPDLEAGPATAIHRTGRRSGR